MTRNIEVTIIATSFERTFRRNSKNNDEITLWSIVDLLNLLPHLKYKFSKNKTAYNVSLQIARALHPFLISNDTKDEEYNFITENIDVLAGRLMDYLYKIIEKYSNTSLQQATKGSITVTFNKDIFRNNLIFYLISTNFSNVYNNFQNHFYSVDDGKFMEMNKGFFFNYNWLTNQQKIKILFSNIPQAPPLPTELPKFVYKINIPERNVNWNDVDNVTYKDVYRNVLKRDPEYVENKLTEYKKTYKIDIANPETFRETASQLANIIVDFNNLDMPDAILEQHNNPIEVTDSRLEVLQKQYLQEYEAIIQTNEGIKWVTSENTEDLIRLRAIATAVENLNAPVDGTHRYVYSFLINNKWLSYTLDNPESWRKLINCLKNDDLVFNTDEIMDIEWSNAFYDEADQQLPPLSIIKGFRIRKIEINHIRNDFKGQFFPYRLKEEYKGFSDILKIAQIFTSPAIYKTVKNMKGKTKQIAIPLEAYKYNCITYALNEASKQCHLNVSNKEWKVIFKEICRRCIRREQSKKSLKTIADDFKIRINICHKDNKRKREENRNKLGPEHDNIMECDIGLYRTPANKNHFFFNPQVPVSNYFLKHYEDIMKYANEKNHDFDWCCKVVQFKSNNYKQDKARFTPISMLDLISTLFEMNAFEPLHLNDVIDIKSDMHNYIKEEITRLDYSEANVRPVGTALKRKKNNKENDKLKYYFYADFEADPTGKQHVPYCCSLRLRGKDKTKTFYSEDCVKDLLESLLDNSTVYFHNLGYDGRFILQYGVCSSINKGSKIMNMKVKYNDKIITFRDSYSMITLALKKFPETFKEAFSKMNIKKEIFPYKYYTINNVRKNIGIISEADKYETIKWTPQQKTQFEQNIDEIPRCRLSETTFDMQKYCTFYCEQDVKLLALGHTEYRRMTLEKPIELDIDDYISTPALSNAFFMKNVYGKIPNLMEYSGVVREFIQKGVYGGRCMTGLNEPWKIMNIIADFDACSLYPSAMARLNIPTGKPLVITEEMLKGSYLIDHVLSEQERVTTKDKFITAFFVEINITKVGKNRDFPLICKRTKQGNSNVNECCTMFVDNYVLEDLIKYQEIEYEVVRGYYWNRAKSPLLSMKIREIYNKRVEYKKQKNPIQQVLKDIMNSAYGKTIQKPIKTDFIYRQNKAADVYLSKNYAKIVEFSEIGGGITSFKTFKVIDQHYVPNFIGVQILSLSKRIMNEVMCTAQDIGIKIYYQDTDSMHIRNDVIPRLANKYRKLFKRELIGSDMGQFHNDFAHIDETSKDVKSILSILLTKKIYCDKLINEHDEIDYHLRMKGIPQDSILNYVIKNYNGNPIKLFEDLLEGKTIAFNILDVKSSFIMGNDSTIKNRSKFTRNIRIVKK